MLKSKQEIYLNKETGFKQVQDAFTGLYPFLKIDFIRNPGMGGKAGKIYSNEHLSNYSKNGIYDVIDIQNSRTVAQIEQDFKSILNVSVKVLRRAGTVWIPTTRTTTWTLEQQNREGEYITGMHEKN